MFSTVSIILKLLCGVALFLYGMSVMGDGLKKVAGNKLESLLYKLTNTPLKGILLGTAVTAVIQSSSATSVMVVGFVNSGMMKVAQGIGIIMGANIGTSITGWILCLSYIDGSEGIASLLSTATISAVVAIIGIILKNFTKRSTNHYLGEIMLGFAVLMTGMQSMSAAVSPLKESPTFINVLTQFSNPFIGILIGIVFTAILQSASASVGILQALATTGGISFATALPITMGIGIGAACPVLMSSIGTNKNGKRTALIYLLNDLFGMIFWSIVFYTANFVVGGFPFMNMVMTPVTVAAMNSIYRILTIMELSPFIKQLEKLVFFIIKDSPEDLAEQKDFDILEERFLEYPDLAIAQAHTAIMGMAKKARKNVLRSMNLLRTFDELRFNKVQSREELIDKYEDKLGTYLLKITKRELNGRQMKETSKYLRTLTDFERIGDHSASIAYVAKEMKESKNGFSKQAQAEIVILLRAVEDIVDQAYDCFKNDDLDSAKKVEVNRRIVSEICAELKSRHIRRLQEGKCNASMGMAWNDVLTDLERVAAHCSNIAIAVMENYQEDLEAHVYENKVKDEEIEAYKNAFDEMAAKYQLPTMAEIDMLDDEDLGALIFNDDENEEESEIEEENAENDIPAVAD